MATATAGARVSRRLVNVPERVRALVRRVAAAAAPWFAVLALMSVVWLTGFAAQHAPVMAAPIVLALTIAAFAPWPMSRRTMATSAAGVLAVALGSAALAVAP